MNIQYKIIKKDPANRQIVVRFFTAVLDVFRLAAEREANGSPVLDANGLPTHCRTDYLVTFPLRILTAEEQTNLIMAHCPWRWMEDEERLINAQTTADAVVNAVSLAIAALPDAPGVMTFIGTPPVTPESIKAESIKKIDVDVDVIYAQAIGNRSIEYTTAEEQAQAYKDANYTGSIPSFVASWVAASGLSAQAAADNILAQAAAWRGAVEVIRTQRLQAKANINAGVPTTMTQWNGFVAGMRAQLGL